MEIEQSHAPGITVGDLSPSEVQELFSPKTTEEFLQWFPGSLIQYLPDSQQCRGAPRCAAAFDRAIAEERQRQGYGIYFCPNLFKEHRQKNCLAEIRCLYCDLDVAKEGDGTPVHTIEQHKQEKYAMLRAFPLPPHCVIDTKNGLQPIWCIKPIPLEQFEEAEARLIVYFGGDPGAKDVTRLLRLPGFSHLKKPQEPYLCTLTFDRLYAL